MFASSAVVGGWWMVVLEQTFFFKKLTPARSSDVRSFLDVFRLTVALAQNLTFSV
jgi:hypothetical protein